MKKHARKRSVNIVSLSSFTYIKKEENLRLNFSVYQCNYVIMRSNFWACRANFWRPAGSPMCHMKQCQVKLWHLE